jgi:SAM-dependent methyltransferase
MMLTMRDATIHNKHVQLIGAMHVKLVHRRRVVVLAERLKAMLPASSTLLDVGCGDGTIAKLISRTVPGLKVTGVEYSPRDNCAIPCIGFDGARLPFPDKSFDGGMFVDVLHHSLDPLTILRDAARVCRSFILIKDHVAENAFDHWTLRLMDWVGNKPHGVVLPYAYLSSEQWMKLYRGAGLAEQNVDRAIPLYPAPFSFIFGRNLHFISALTIDPVQKS